MWPWQTGTNGDSGPGTFTSIYVVQAVIFVHSYIGLYQSILVNKYPPLFVFTNTSMFVISRNVSIYIINNISWNWCFFMQLSVKLLVIDVILIDRIIIWPLVIKYD